MKNRKFKHSQGQRSTAAESSIKRRFGPKRVLKYLLLAILAFILIVLIYSAVVIVRAPKIDTSKINLSQSTYIYDENNNKVDTVFSGENRVNIKYEQLPDNLVNAFVAIEDKTFWKHHGFNFIRMLGAIKGSIFSGGSISGTSTISQQLARNVYLPESRFERSIKRKIIEAWYTRQIERDLSKKEILTAYLNTINLGYNSYGVQAAAQAYFSKDVSRLTLAQCAALASLPQSPTNYSLVQIVDPSQMPTSTKNILHRNSTGTYIMNDSSKPRRDACLKEMLNQGYINQKEYNQAVKTSLRNMLKPKYSTGANSNTTYFTDHVVKTVISDLSEKEGISKEAASEKVYTGGLKIYSTMDSTAQRIIQKKFRKNNNFPQPTKIRYDSKGNILDNYGHIALYDYKDYFSRSGKFRFHSGEAKLNNDGSLTILSGKRLRIYTTQSNGVTDYSIEFPNMYRFRDGQLYSISGGYINIPGEFKTKDKRGNLIVSKKFINSSAGRKFFLVKGNTIRLSPTSYTLNQEIIQPQAAMAIVENKTGELKAMVGGRKTTGRMLYNRATGTHQPGSSIKPLAIYGAAIQQSYEESERGVKHTFIDHKIDKQGVRGWGNYITAGSACVDEPTRIGGRTWPKNSGGGYSGMQTLRTAMKNSINTCAVKIYMQEGQANAAKMVKKFGITTLVENKAVSDENPAAMALGGMTKGVSPLEMANAYTTFPNNGSRAEKSICYTKVVDSEGHVILSNDSPKRVEVLNEGVAWIMADMMKDVVRGGTGTLAALPGVQVGGKTGTTSDEYDIWFDGFTPSYSASLWIGNDMKISLSSMSSYAARLWSKIMRKVPKSMEGQYKAMPSNVKRIGGEYYAGDTYSPGMYQYVREQRVKRAAERKRRREEQLKRERAKRLQKAREQRRKRQQQQQQSQTKPGSDTENP